MWRQRCQRSGVKEVWKNCLELTNFLTSSGPTTTLEVHLSAAAGVHDRQVKLDKQLPPSDRDEEMSMYFIRAPENKFSMRFTIHPANWQCSVEMLVR